MSLTWFYYEKKRSKKGIPRVWPDTKASACIWRASPCLKQCGLLAHRYWSTHSHLQTARIRQLCSIRTILTVIPGTVWHSKKHTEFQCPGLVVSLSVTITFWNVIINCIMGIKLGTVLWPWKRMCKLPNIFLIWFTF